MKERKFRDLDPPLSPGILQALESSEGFSYQATTPVQAATIPHFLTHKDVLVEAATGSGKTLAFAIPVLEILLRSSMTSKIYEVGARIAYYYIYKHFTILTDAHTHTPFSFLFYPIITCCTANLASSIIFNTDDKRSRFASVSAVSLNSSFTFAGSYKA